MNRVRKNPIARTVERSGATDAWQFCTSVEGEFLRPAAGICAVINIARKVVNRISRAPKQRMMRRRLVRPEAIAELNRRYNLLSLEAKRDFYELYSQICRAELKTKDYRELWSIDLQNGVLKLPLYSDQLWLHWDSAVSVLGHDLKVKQSYVNLLKSAERPDLFVDIGANYGTHSLLFMSEGVRTITFEPNPTCFDYFRTSCSLNGLDPQLEAVALGDRRGTVELCFPQRETWLGSADPEVAEALQACGPTVMIPVQLAFLDDYLPQLRDYRKVLVKIDVEGMEEQVLNGAKQTLETVQPLIIFECNARSRLKNIASILSASNYVIAPLPWSEEGAAASTADDMATTRDTNFLAIPPSRRQAFLAA